MTTLQDIRRFQGDVWIFVNGDDSTMKFDGGQPIMDQSNFMAFQVSIFTKPNWVGNFFIKNPDHRIGSRFLESLDAPINLDQLNVIRNEAEKAVDWMLEKAIYSSINVTVTNPRDNDLYVIWVCENSNSGVVTTYAFARKGESYFFDIMVED